MADKGFLNATWCVFIPSLSQAWGSDNRMCFAIARDYPKHRGVTPESKGMRSPDDY